MRVSFLALVSLLAACSNVPDNGADQFAPDENLPAPLDGLLDDVTTMAAGETNGPFNGMANCEDLRGQLATTADDLGAILSEQMLGCDGDCGAADVDWATQAALVVWTSCTDACGRTLSYDDGKVTEGALSMSYELYNPSPWGCAEAPTRVWSVDAIPTAAYAGVDVSFFRTEAPTDSGF